MSYSHPSPETFRYSAEKEFGYLGIEKPGHIVMSVLDITGDLLQNMGVELIMLDIDGTIKSDGGGSLESVGQETINHVNNFCHDFSLCFVTMGNRRAKGVQACFGRPHPVYGVTSLPEELRTNESAPWATKEDHPERYYGRALQHFGVEPQKSVAIGNEIYADVVGPRSLGAQTIFVDGYNVERIKECLSEPGFMQGLSKREKRTWRSYSSG